MNTRYENFLIHLITFLNDVVRQWRLCDIDEKLELLELEIYFVESHFHHYYFEEQEFPGVFFSSGSANYRSLTAIGQRCSPIVYF